MPAVTRIGDADVTHCSGMTRAAGSSNVFVNGIGISREGEILDMASELDIVQKSGAWYSYNEERLGQGRENSKQFLKENTDLREEIAFFIREHHGISEDSGAEGAEDSTLLD